MREVKRVDKICGSPLMALVAEAWAEMERNGYSLAGAPYSHDGSAFYIEDNGRPVAFLHWEVSDWKQEMWIQLGYVVPEYRRQGLYTQLYNATLEEAHSRELRSIAGGVHADNAAMRSVAIMQGRAAEFVTYRAKLVYDPPA